MTYRITITNNLTGQDIYRDYEDHTVNDTMFDEIAGGILRDMIKTLKDSKPKF